jgi:hypothetical protein
MTTPTKPKLTPAKALAEFLKREAAWGEGEAEVRRRSRELADALTRSRALHDERRKLIHRNPQLVNHLDEPIGRDNPITAIDREMKQIGDLPEFEAKAAHAKRLATSAKQAAADYIAAHYPLVIEGRREEAERVTANANEKLAETRTAAAEYLGLVQSLIGWTVLAQRNPRDVPHLDGAAELSRLLKGWALQPPLPELPDE